MIFNTIIHAIRSRLATRLILAVVLLLSAVSIILTTFFITRQEKLLTKELYKRANALAQNLAYNSRHYLLLPDRSTIQSFVTGVKEEADINNVYLTNLDGTILASTDTSQTKKIIPISAENELTYKEAWISIDDETKRVIVPVEVAIPFIDTDAMLIPASADSITQQYDNLRQITFFHPCFNHTSDEVTFSTTSVAEDYNMFSIMSASLSNRRLRVLIESASNPSWSHNGYYLAFNKRIAPRITELTLYERETGSSKGIIREENSVFGLPCFSNDDQFIITTMQTPGGPKLFKIPLDGGKPDQLTYDFGDHWFPDCSPDGRWILYVEYIEKELCVYNTETKESSQLFPGSKDLCWGGSFSPDGTEFCYVRCTDSVPQIRDIFIAPFPAHGNPCADSTNFGTQLTFNGGWKWGIDWSPDGKWISYCQRDAASRNRGDIWIVPAQGGDPVNLTASVQTYRNTIGYAILDVSMENLYRAISKDNRTALIITFIFTGIGILCAFVLVRNIVRPVQKVAHAAEEFARGNFDQTISTRRSDEIGILTDTFDRMMQQLKLLISEKDERRRELEKAYKELQTLDKAKDDFLSLVSHELRTPLSSILLSSQMLLRKQVDSEEKKSSYIASIVDDSKRLTRLINEVLDLSKIEAGRMAFTFEPLNIRELVKVVAQHFQVEFERKNIHFHDERIPGDVYLRGDRDKIIQVLTNIISNALKFTPDGGSITVSIRCNDETATVAVRDTGEGIRSEDIPKVFDRFCQLETINHHSEGTGLGMTIIKSIIERHGGTIRIESEFGIGTTVFFTLPLAEIPAEERHDTDDNRQPAVQPEFASQVSKHKKILIVDDEKTIRMALTDCFSKQGFDTLEATAGTEVIHLVESQQPELIILDVMLPGMSGLEICRKLRGKPNTKGIKIIMLSARGQEKEKEEGLKAGADRYITKPFDYEELLSVVEDLLKK